MYTLNHEHVKEYTPRLDLASIGDVVAIGYGRYKVLDKWDTRAGRGVYLLVKRLASLYRDEGKPFQMMVAKQGDNREQMEHAEDAVIYQ